MLLDFICLMIRRTTRPTRTDKLFTYATLFRSPDYREAITFDHEFWKNLDAQTAFVARTFNDYCQGAEDDRVQGMIEDKMPEVTMFAFVLQKELNSLMEQIGRAPSELQSLMRISYTVFCLNKKTSTYNRKT